jgi:hypothetical protein
MKHIIIYNIRPYFLRTINDENMAASQNQVHSILIILFVFILWYVEPLLYNGRETSNYTTAIAK